MRINNMLHNTTKNPLGIRDKISNKHTPMKCILPIFASILFLLIVTTYDTLAFAQTHAVSNQTILDTARAVVRVTSKGCSGSVDRRTSSGFVWQKSNTVITTLHSVANCSDINISYVHYGISRSAKVNKILSHADLALLEVNNAPNSDFIASKQSHSAGMKLATIGFPLNTVNWQESQGAVGLNVSKLSEILNDEARAKIASLGIPDLGIDAFRLTAIVKAGSSGGPIINQNGDLIGIVDGGLDGGSAMLNWGIPVSYVDHLLNSNEDSSSINIDDKVDIAFSYSSGATLESITEVNEILECGGRRYFKIGTRTLKDIVKSVHSSPQLDDPNSFLTMVNNWSTFIDPIRLENIHYDMWVDEQTGATLSIPNEMEVHNEGAICVAEDSTSDVRLYFKSVVAPNVAPHLIQNYVQQASIQFENLAMQSIGNIVGCAPDPVWSSFAPHQRFDGMIVRRQNYYCDNTAWQRTYSVVGHFSREGSYAGVNAYVDQYNQLGPAGDPDLNLRWAAAALSVLISNYQL
ncbi:S1 family peptidase [Curvivirga sp.]|uniref:S1 family peptidase n=1 Tax=Curvivirga sp. TaxID=2856848 RepID=UPI003B58FC8C